VATDAQSLVDQSKCYLCFGVSEAEALELALLKTLVESGTGSGSGTAIETESSQDILTELGDTLVTE
jgi:hypothetical protein